MRSILLSLMLLLLSSPAFARKVQKEVCKTYEGTANWTGPSGRIYVNTNVYFKVDKGRLYIKNYSKTEHGKVSSDAAGLHGYVITPGMEEYHSLAVYTAPGKTVTVDLSVTWCKKEWVDE
jgi:hypothetical protein